MWRKGKQFYKGGLLEKDVEEGGDNFYIIKIGGYLKRLGEEGETNLYQREILGKVGGGRGSTEGDIGKVGGGPGHSAGYTMEP